MRTHMITLSEVAQPVYHKLASTAHGDGRHKVLIMVITPGSHKVEYHVTAVHRNVRSENGTYDLLPAAVRAYNAISWV